MSDKVNSEVNKQYFKRNRYIKEDILAAFEKAETINRTIRLDITSIDTLEIHLKDKQTISIDLIKEIIFEIPTFDNYVQDFCELNSERSSLSYGNYMVYLAWISIEQNKVVMGYWGEYVNIELRAIFAKSNSVWKNEDIYWQYLFELLVRNWVTNYK